jgi:hypothetical protein
MLARIWSQPLIMAFCRYLDCDGNVTNGCEAGPAVGPLHGAVGCVDQKLAVLACDTG